MNLSRLIVVVLLPVGLLTAARAQIPKPDDAPLPLPAAESATHFTVPTGFRVELIACEPLVREPSGVCWDEKGQLFVCELHGYNLEGQYDIEELNKSGQLDRVVRRIQADQRHKQAAEAETYGTIKRLHDTDGDGQMDRADLWADRLPPCLGICPARGGIIAACQTQILFLADRDDDGMAEVREVLFEGFAKGLLERMISAPQWGPDNWIYFSNSGDGGTIRGKYLAQPVVLPRTDFRIRADGSAIEPIVGNTGTTGFAFTESGDRFVVSTGAPGIFVAPIEWRYLARNPNVATPRLERRATSDQRSWPTSQPHPWRTRRAKDPGFSKYYSDRYGMQESTPNGYFTSACWPLVYRDVALPGLRGQLLACEPAQNFVHRAIVVRDGVALNLRRPDDEQQAEFLTSSDPWFHPIALSHAPDGRVAIVDFYREIIEDYSAIPRYLQQQYGLDGGREHGRIWCLSHVHLDKEHKEQSSGDFNSASTAATSASPAMAQLSVTQLVTEVGSDHLWRRETARRLLVERQSQAAVALLSQLVRDSTEPHVMHNALHTLDGLQALTAANVCVALRHPDWSVRRQALRFAERWLSGRQNAEIDARKPAATVVADDAAAVDMLDSVLRLLADDDPAIRLQLALTLGESPDPRGLQALVQLARTDGDELWMPLAILTSVADRGGRLLTALLQVPNEVGDSAKLLEPLCAAIASRQDRDEVAQALLDIAALKNPEMQERCLSGMRSAIRGLVDLQLASASSTAVKALAASVNPGVQQQALALVRLLSLETPAERLARWTQATRDLGNLQLSSDAHLAAVYQLADEPDTTVTQALLAAATRTTPRVREAVVSAIVGRQDRFPALLDALETQTLPASFLTAVQRASLLEAKDADIRQRAAKLLEQTSKQSDEVFTAFVEALGSTRDVAHGAEVFRTKCANCHQAHDIGFAVGPDLNAEFQRAEETIIGDVLAPSDTISGGYVTYSVLTTSGQVASGLLATESPTSITLRQAEGKEQLVLRKDIEELTAMSVSMMPDDLLKTVTPTDLADLLAWLRRPPTALVLLDENREFVSALAEGAGSAEFITTDKYHGDVCLRVTPPQRYSPRIAGWQFRIREHPAPGEYRYLRFAWKSAGAHGVMMELAADGHWPPSNQPRRRYHAGRNSSGWQSTETARAVPEEWTVVTRDLWQDFGDFTLTGFAPTAMGGPVLFDRIELLQAAP